MPDGPRTLIGQATDLEFGIDCHLLRRLRIPGRTFGLPGGSVSAMSGAWATDI